MSLLNQIYATPSRVKGVVQFFTRERGQKLKRETAEELLSPASLLRPTDEAPGGRRAMVQGAIDECVRLGLLREDGDSLVLDPELPDAARRYETVANELPAVILDRVLDPRSDMNQDLAAALAWYLGQDVLAAPGTWEEFGNALVTQGANDVLRFNDNRFKMFFYWSRYLGLANVLGVPVSATETDHRLTPDPTECIRRLAGEILGTRSGRVPVAEFLQGVRVRCSLFEGGEIRDTMQRLTAPREAKYLSSTTSHALLRLEEDGTLELRMLSDADAVLLVDGQRPRPVSEVVWRRATPEAA